jgi:hypothetical protein
MDTESQRPVDAVARRPPEIILHDRNFLAALDADRSPFQQKVLLLLRVMMRRALAFRLKGDD